MAKVAKDMVGTSKFNIIKEEIATSCRDIIACDAMQKL